MRIIAGKFRHRKINMVGVETTRETQDYMRETVFNTIGQFYDGGLILDLFGGSGSMGIEGISRGLDKAYFSDINEKALSTIKENLKSLGIENQAVIYPMSYDKALEKMKGLKFRVIILDPPYALNVCNEIIKFIYDNNMYLENTYIACEIGIENTFLEEIGNFYLYKEKIKGIKREGYYKIRRP